MTTQNPWRAGAGFDEALEMFENAEASAEITLGPIASGKYKARLCGGELEKSRMGNTCFVLRWEITEGKSAGRRLISRSWLTPRAIARAKAELNALGIDGKHLRGAAPLPDVLAELSVVCRCDESQDLYNEVRRIKPIAVQAQAEKQAAAIADAPVDDAPIMDDWAFLDAEF